MEDKSAGKSPVDDVPGVRPAASVTEAELAKLATKPGTGMLTEEQLRDVARLPRARRRVVLAEMRRRARKK